MTDALLEWKSFGPAFARGWNGFFHSTFDGRVLRILRVFYAVILLVNILTWFPYLELWFGEAGVLPLAVSRQVISADSWTIFSYLPTSSSVLYVSYFCFLTQAVLLLFGIFPRFQAVCAFIWLVSFQHRNIMICDGEDVVMRLVGFFVMLMPLHQIGAQPLPRMKVTKPSSGFGGRTANNAGTLRVPFHSWTSSARLFS